MIYKYIKHISAALLAGMALAGCSDEWNEHYDASAVNDGTLWQAISSQSDLTHFASVVKACGYDVVLDGSQTYSVFAPTDATFSAAEADSLIAEFKRQQSAGTRPNDNTVVRQFLQNHIALYRHPVSSLTLDSITMMNNKYEVLTHTHLGNRQLLSSNALYDNGLLFTIDRKLDYFPNVFEYLGHDSELDSVYQFLNAYSVYEFDETKSVPGEIVDGQTVYLDSVSVLINPLLESFGLIDSEDSTYWMVCPTNDEWSRLLAEYEPYFNYPNNVARRDSMFRVGTRQAIIGGTIFSRTTNPDVAFRDSAVSTSAPSSLVRALMGNDYPYYTYFRPFDAGGVFYGTDDIVCSNGHVLKARDFRISKYETFLQTVKVEAEAIQSQDTIINAVEPLVVREVVSTNPFYGKVSGNTFVEVQPDPATAQVTVQYKIPNILSNVGYDIYAVFVPATAYDTLAVAETTRPNIVRTTLYWSDQNGREARRIYNKDLTTRPDVVDTVQLVSNYTFPTCSYGLADAAVKVAIRSNVRTNQTSTHSSTLRLDCLIVRPHREAE
ncbi:MAG: fasciclin domain-containing protein [Prevotella sp.]|nr:fasciclin domain-containing protein [Prevotella sp.]